MKSLFILYKAQTFGTFLLLWKIMSNNLTNVTFTPQNVYGPKIYTYLMFITMGLDMLGVFGNLISIKAFHFQIKQETAYFHQLVIMLNDLATAILLFFGALEYIIFGWVSPAEFLVSGLLRVVCFPLSVVFFTSTLMVMCGVASDRIYSLEHPLEYQNSNHKIQALKLGAFSLIMAIFLHTSRLFKGVAGEFFHDTYDWYISQTYSQILNSIPSIFGVFSWFYMTYLMIKLAKKYKQVQHHRKMLRQANMVGNSAEPVHEKTLTKLIQAQLCLVTLNQFVTTCYLVVSNLPDGVNATIFSFALFPLYGLTSRLQVDFNFLMYIILSKNFRKIVKNVLCGANNE